MDHRPCTTIFAKRPLAGQVKTRLSPPLDPEQASDLALAMLDDTVQRELADHGSDLALAVSPPGELAWFEERYPSVPFIRVQEGQGLGERLAAWFEGRLGEASSVVVVGSDCPHLDAGLVGSAHERLSGGADVVFAPDVGGGYALVGLSRPAPELFLDVPMSVPDNLALTLDCAARLGLAVELLPEQRDVDTEEDLLAVARLLNTRVQEGRDGEGFPTRTHALLQEFLLGTGAH